MRSEASNEDSRQVDEQPLRSRALTALAVHCLVAAACSRAARHGREDSRALLMSAHSTHDAGGQALPGKRPYSPCAGRNFPIRPLLRRHASAHGAFRWMPARSAPGSGRAMPIKFRQGRRDRVLDGTAGRSCRGRSISSSSPTIPTIWASSPTCSLESPSSSPIRWAANGTT